MTDIRTLERSQYSNADILSLSLSLFHVFLCHLLFIQKLASHNDPSFTPVAYLLSKKEAEVSVLLSSSWHGKLYRF
jgi:hypothetical protein